MEKCVLMLSFNKNGELKTCDNFMFEPPNEVVVKSSKNQVCKQQYGLRPRKSAVFGLRL